MHLLKPELINDPHNQAENYADDQAGDQREVEGAALAAVDDVSRQAAQAERQLVAEIKERAQDHEHGSHENQRASELLRRLHSEDCSASREFMGAEQRENRLGGAGGRQESENSALPVGMTAKQPGQ